MSWVGRRILLLTSRQYATFLPFPRCYVKHPDRCITDELRAASSLRLKGHLQPCLTFPVFRPRSSVSCPERTPSEVEGGDEGSGAAGFMKQTLTHHSAINTH